MIIFKILYRTIKAILYVTALYLLFVVHGLTIFIKYILTGDLGKDSAFEKWCINSINNLTRI